MERFLAGRYNGVLKTSLRGVKVAGDDSPAPGPQQTISRLRGLGRELYEQFATPNFRKALEQLRAGPAANGGFELRTIQINTNNPALPWELMVPCADQSCGFLGVDYQVARWHISDRTPAERTGSHPDQFRSPQRPQRVPGNLARPAQDHAHSPRHPGRGLDRHQPHHRQDHTVRLLLPLSPQHPARSEE